MVSKFNICNGHFGYRKKEKATVLVGNQTTQIYGLQKGQKPERQREQQNDEGKFSVVGVSTLYNTSP